MNNERRNIQTGSHDKKVANGTRNSVDDRHSEEIQEIINKSPSWILKWGIPMFFGLFIILFVVAGLIRYPDIVRVPLKIQSYQNSLPVNAILPGRVIKVSVKQGDFVKQGQLLAEVESMTDPKNNYSLLATQSGKLSFVSIVEANRQLDQGQKVFLIHPLNRQFFGVIEVYPNNINKIKVGQKVLITLSNYPVDEYGQLKGKISYIADEPGEDGYFAAKITLDTQDLRKQIEFKNWMDGSAGVITQDMSLQERIYKSLFKELQ